MCFVGKQIVIHQHDVLHSVRRNRTAAGQFLIALDFCTVYPQFFVRYLLQFGNGFTVEK